jgi:hypothetical protein
MPNLSPEDAPPRAFGLRLIDDWRSVLKRCAWSVRLVAVFRCRTGG